MKYKALISDVDGTLVPYNLASLPSKKVIQAIHKAKDKIHIGVATSRPLFMMEEIFSLLELSGPSVLAGGAQVYDTTTKKIIYVNPMDRNIVETIVKKLKTYTTNFIITDGNLHQNHDYTFFPEKPLGIWIFGLEEEMANKIVEEFSSPTVSAHKVISSRYQGKTDAEISDITSTKQQGILKVAEVLGISTHEIIGIGDSYNDFPLLMACGLKVAMGNAAPELKAIADYVAPSVENDGVADVIEKFVLQ